MGIGYYGGASFSPDGKNITFHGTIPSDENIPAFQKLLSEHRLVDISVSEIFTIDVETNEFTQITFDGKSNQNPIYTKDGKSIIFERTDEDNKHSLWQINLDGRKKQIEVNFDLVYYLTFSAYKRIRTGELESLETQLRK
jgi:Tol biopolymer transport system component